MILRGFEVIDDLAVIKKVQTEYKLPDFYSSCSNILGTVTPYIKNGKALVWVHITHERFIEDVHKALLKADKVHTIIVKMPYFSDKDIGEHVMEWMEKKYPKFEFAYRHIKMEHKGAEVHMTYPMVGEILENFEKHYPEELI